MDARFEYLITLTVLLIFIFSAYLTEILIMHRRLSFWVSFLVYLSGATIFDAIAIYLGWWRFSVSKICGIILFGIPFEEFLLFYIVFVATIAAWESMHDKLA